MDDKQISKDFWQDFDKSVEKTLVPRLSSEAIKPCTEENFQDFRKELQDNLNYIISLLDVILQNEEQWTTKTKKNLIKVIVIIGEQHCKNPWCSDETVEISKLMAIKICKLFCCENITQTLKDEDVFLSIITCIRPKLLKNTWKYFPAAVVCYKWLLTSIEKPLLKRYVKDVIPTALIIFDDYVEENQAVGLDCMNLIIEHCHKSRSLKNFNYDEVIYQALEKRSRNVDSKLIIPLYACISNLLENFQYCDDNNITFGWTKRDDILYILLDNMELQTNHERRYAYVISLTNIMTHSSIGKWTKRLTRILCEYCEEDTDLRVTEASFNLLKKFFLIYQPQESSFYTSIYSSLLKIRFNLSLREQDRKTIIEKVDECLSFLNKQCPHLSKELYENPTIKSIL